MMFTLQSVSASEKKGVAFRTFYNLVTVVQEGLWDIVLLKLD